MARGMKAGFEARSVLVSSMGFQRSNPAALRSAARREQEDAAPRLLSEVPALKSLALTLEERRQSANSATGSGMSDAGSHIRRIVVEHAPALFHIPCGNRACQDGGHDLTRAILHALRDGQVAFEGDDACHGSTVAGQACELFLRYRAQATYEASFDPSPAR